MLNFNRNNLDQALSPYLRQHESNPVWWQEWTKEVLEHARETSKPILVSVGYATCHWCHVMAAEAFSDRKAADYLNENFVCIKVDREQRPDIDQFMMRFLVDQSGSGGWPLNCFLTPGLKPFFALTYVPLTPRYGMQGFLDVLQKIKGHYDQSGEKFESFSMPADKGGEAEKPDFVNVLKSSFDLECGGFGYGPKFPPHSTLIFMLYYFAASGDLNIKHMLEKTLDNILSGGLHDHLQGGFFRYCVDREWTIPHFEKMLYDQAMLLWVFSLASRVLHKEAYRMAVVKLLKCLQETFEQDGLYYSGHDADTDHAEGASYLWSQKELFQLLTPEEYALFADTYRISADGNFEGKNHLVKRKDLSCTAIDEKLLAERKRRKQPFVDRKIITSWNCLAGVGLVQAHRYADTRGALEKAETVATRLLRDHFKNNMLSHSSFDGKVQQQGFLQDYAALLLLLTYLHEETGRFGDDVQTFCRKIRIFKQKSGWLESFNDDFFPVWADSFDQPAPSSISLAEFALLRADILMGRAYTPRSYRRTLNNDFYNVAALMANGSFHIIETPVRMPWGSLPINSLQKKSDQTADCYNGICQEIPLKTPVEGHF
jgi:uncharacterized protein